MTLYELTAEYRRFQAMIEDGEIAPEDMADTLEAISGDITEKLDATAKVVKNLKVLVDGLRDEEKALAERRKANENAIDRIKEYIVFCLSQAGETRFETVGAKISLRNTSRVVFDDEEALTAWADEHLPEAVTRETVTKISKNEIGEYIKNGGEVAGARIENAVSAIIK